MHPIDERAYLATTHVRHIAIRNALGWAALCHNGPTWSIGDEPLLWGAIPPANRRPRDQRLWRLPVCKRCIAAAAAAVVQASAQDRWPL